MIILKFIINVHNYQLNVYYNYNDNQLYIYSTGIIYIMYINVNRLHELTYKYKNILILFISLKLDNNV
jgi:hypothetical protein